MAMMTSPLAVHGDPLLSTAYRTPSPLLGKSYIPLHGHGHGLFLRRNGPARTQRSFATKSPCPCRARVRVRVVEFSYNLTWTRVTRAILSARDKFADAATVELHAVRMRGGAGGAGGHRPPQ